MERPLDQLTSELVAAFRRQDETAALRVIETALANQLDGPAIYLGVFQPALDQMGCLWESGQVSVADEHYATALTEWLMRSLSFDFQAQTGRAGHRPLLACCVQGERHDLGITMVADFLRRDGWPMVGLGADVPTQDLARMAARIQPGLCLLSTARAELLAALDETISELHGLLPKLPILVGGVLFRHFPALPTPDGAAAVAHDATSAVTEVRRLLGA